MLDNSIKVGNVYSNDDDIVIFIKKIIPEMKLWFHGGKTLTGMRIIHFWVSHGKTTGRKNVHLREDEFISGLIKEGFVLREPSTKVDIS